VSGVLSLIETLEPLDARGALSILKNSAENLGNNLFFGSGLLNAEAALEMASPSTPTQAQLIMQTASAPADGVSQIKATVKLARGGSPLVGQEIKLSTSGENVIINRHLLATSALSTVGFTDSAGELSFEVASTSAGVKGLALYAEGETVASSSVTFTWFIPFLRAAWVSQSAYPNLKVGQETTLELRLKNIGNTAWLGGGSIKGQVRLGTDRPRDRQSSFVHSSWLSQDRPALLTPAVVLPGEIGTFTFTAKASQEGVFREYFRPVAEYVSWFNDLGIYWEMRVEEISYDAQLLSQGALSSGEGVWVWAEFKNTGTTTWKRQGSGIGEIRLGTSQPQDHPSSLFLPSWISSNRAAALENDVPPGSTARLTFEVNKAGLPIQESFRLVAEYIRWFGPGITFNLT